VQSNDLRYLHIIPKKKEERRKKKKEERRRKKKEERRKKKEERRKKKEERRKKGKKRNGKVKITFGPSSRQQPQKHYRPQRRSPHPQQFADFCNRGDLPRCILQYPTQLQRFFELSCPCHTQKIVGKNGFHFSSSNGLS
jgi:outer membrane biosynthesis protein TonB